MEDDAPAGVPEWVVTYGDMMSLLLTFFIMLVSLSEINADKKYRAILESLEQYLGYSGAPPSAPGRNFPGNSMVSLADEAVLGSPSSTDPGLGGTKRPSAAGNDVHVYRLPEGHSVREGRVLRFGADDDSLDAAGQLELQAIARSLAGKPNKIEVRAMSGPGSAAPFRNTSQRYQMAFRRGQGIRVELERYGVEHDRIRLVMDLVAQPGDSSDQTTEFPLDRAEIHVRDEFAEEFVGTPERYEGG